MKFFLMYALVLFKHACKPRDTWLTDAIITQHMVGLTVHIFICKFSKIKSDYIA